MREFQVGSLVRVRQREWVVIERPNADLMVVRPLGGSEAETCGIFLPLERGDVQPAEFAPPTAHHVGDFVAGQLLRNAARLTLRSGAGPFRSLGRLGVRPRPYQLVPLIMALRLSPVRLLIADDVGIGKTIEAGAIVRELLDRGEIKRLAVLCPPHLCDQWQRELSQKFGIDAVIVRSSTRSALERAMPASATQSVWEYYPWTIASIDYVKSEHHRAVFLHHCPPLVIVDEAHTAARPGGKSTTQQQRFNLLHDIAAQPERNLLLLTATPHSGIEEAFKSLLGLLNPAFETYDLQQLTDTQREALSRHFVQRRRADVKQWMGADTPFPERESLEVLYQLKQSPAYRTLFNDVLTFAQELVRDTSGAAWRVRVRYWAALALLRCVMSSPAAAQKAFNTRLHQHEPHDLDEPETDDLFGEYVYDRSERETAVDVEPTAVVEQASEQTAYARLRRFAQQAAGLHGDHDPKLLKLVGVLDQLVRAGFQPIVYCRYIATAKYVAEQLQTRLKGFRDGRILAVTGEQSEEERESMIEELSKSPRRLLVATDCLSEGINLQEWFNAVLHYDLPWNPNRLEQREGRVDRYGQPAPNVRTVLLYGDDNPIDQVVMKVLLRKAVTIHRTLGIAVPLPLDSESVVNSLISSLFSQTPRQASLFELDTAPAFDADQVQAPDVELAWNQAVEREQRSRTRFAQKAIKPHEVAQELAESDAVLGNQATVRDFVVTACERLNAPLVLLDNANDVWELMPAQLPLPIQERIPIGEQRAKATPTVRLSFAEQRTKTMPPDVQLVGRNHALTVGLADYLLETALVPSDARDLPAARCGVIRSNQVEQRTIIVVLRIRLLIETPHNNDVLAEQLLTVGCRGDGADVTWLTPDQALTLLETIQPTANMTAEAKHATLNDAFKLIDQHRAQLTMFAREQAVVLQTSHQRVRQATNAPRATVRAYEPPDVLGVYVVVNRKQETGNGRMKDEG
ncbi:MAG: DEAD/DEAH box helicase [Herpetosiphon sp.]|nr:DEAD/DEAH box helicase [Herpetosiphon sp.]